MPRLPFGQHLVARAEVVVEEFCEARGKFKAAAIPHSLLRPFHIRQRHRKVGIPCLVLQDGVDAPGEHVLRVGVFGRVAPFAVLPAHRRQPVVHQFRQGLEVDVRENAAAARTAMKQEVVLQPVARGHVTHHDAHARKRIAYGSGLPFPEQFFCQFVKAVAPKHPEWHVKVFRSCLHFFFHLASRWHILYTIIRPRRKMDTRTFFLRFVLSTARQANVSQFSCRCKHHVRPVYTLPLACVGSHLAAKSL